MQSGYSLGGGMVVVAVFFNYNILNGQKAA